MTLSRTHGYRIAAIAIVIVSLIVGYITVSRQVGQRAKLTLSPEAIPGSATPAVLSFNLTLNTAFPVVSATLVGTDNTKIAFGEATDGTFTASTLIPESGSSRPRTITFALHLNGVKTATTARLAITDIPVTLPPDPGEAGRATLVGTDSDNDGVRDDLQREIVFMYPDNDEARRILRAMTKQIQDVITTEGDQEHFKGLMVSAFAFGNCYAYRVFPLGKYDSTNETFLWTLAQNTPERHTQMEAHQYEATPFESIVGGSAYGCNRLKGRY